MIIVESIIVDEFAVAISTLQLVPVYVEICAWTISEETFNKKSS